MTDREITEITGKSENRIPVIKIKKDEKKKIKKVKKSKLEIKIIM